MCEVGCNNGRTARLLLDNVKTLRKYQGIDVPKGYVPACAVQRNEIPDDPGKYANDDPRFVLRLPKRGSLDLSPAHIGAVDAFFIDGDHSRAAVEHDSNLAKQCVKPGGIIIWHDYHGQGRVDVREVLHDFVKHQVGRDIRYVEGTWLAFERV